MLIVLVNRKEKEFQKHQNFPRENLIIKKIKIMKKFFLNFLNIVMFFLFIVSSFSLIFLFFVFINSMRDEFNGGMQEAKVIVLLPALICLVSFSLGMGIKSILKYFNY